MKKFSIDKILQLHGKMIEATGGDSGIRDIGLLHSAISNAYATFDGVDLYKTIEEKCASVCFSIINNHPFLDGNKRMGIFVMLVFLEYNNIPLKYTQNELIDLGLGIAQGKYKQTYILEWLNGHKD